MCGICGVIDYTDRQVEERVIRSMCSRMSHRGPNDEGVYFYRQSPSVGLGHRRLSIIDLSSAGHQPMANEDRTIWLVMNGEVYNYIDLRKDLEKRGHVFSSHADSETVIHLYEEYGKDCVKFLRGMFAFAIWDEKEKYLLLARDRVGKKPLLYSYNKGIFCFASEFSALLESGFISKDISYESLDLYLSYGYIPAPLTVYRNVYKLRPAHILILKNERIDLEQYWKLDYSQKIDISENEAEKELLRLLREAIKIRLCSDVPLGAFLSGGIDSSTIVALMSELSGKRVKTFSIGFTEKDYNELRYARNIARLFGTEHKEFIVKPQALEVVPLLVERYGEPYADSSCVPTYYVAEQTKKHVTVVLNGDGGDELFGGYERYQAILLSRYFQKMPSFARKAIFALAGLLPDSHNSKNKLRRIKRFVSGADLPLLQRYARWISVFDENLKHNLYSEAFLKKIDDMDYLGLIKPFLGEPYKTSGVIDALLYTDTMTYLPDDLLVKVDIASMANSLECRSPFLDHKLMEFVARLPSEYKIKGMVKKYILKRAIRGMVPAENMHRPKMGFGVPVGHWFRAELKDFLCDNIVSDKFFKRNYFKPEIIKQMVTQHIDRKKDYTLQLWAILMLELWHQRFIDR